MRSKIGAILIGDELLSGKRTDKHLPAVIERLGERGLGLNWARIEPDDETRLIKVFAETIKPGGNTIVFSFGGIGSTPDDLTRQAAAKAAGVKLIRHPRIVRLLEERFHENTYPNRIRMAEIPAGAELIPNPTGLIPGFSLRDHHFLPGFPKMAWEMMSWVLDKYYGSLFRERLSEQLLDVYETPESELVPLMESLLSNHPTIRLSSLPSHGRPWHIEIGIRGIPDEVDAAVEFFTQELSKKQIRWSAGNRI